MTQFRLAAYFLYLSMVSILPTAFALDQTLIVGSKRFPESRILGEIITQTANSVGETQAIHKQGLGNTGILFAALQNRQIDIYPEYRGTIARQLLKLGSADDLLSINRQLAPLGLKAAIRLGFSNTYALAMLEPRAHKLGITRLSQLSNHPHLKFGLSQEFIKRDDGWQQVREVYGLTDIAPQAIEHGLSYEAFASGNVDVIDSYSTDSKIAKYHLRLLKDDRRCFPSYEAMLVYRQDLASRLPKTWAALKKLEHKISTPQMIALNTQVELHNRKPAEVAAQFLGGKLNFSANVGGNLRKHPSTNSPPLANTARDSRLQTSARSATRDRHAKPDFYSLLFAPDFWPQTGRHLFLVLVSLAFSIIIGVPLGILAAHQPSCSGVILVSTGLIQTIPSLALFAFLIPFLGIGSIPALLALFLYSLLPIVRNTYTGLLDIPPSLRESALALGLPFHARLFSIELPLALRSILAGIKTSAVINVGLATIATFIGAGGYGDRISAGLELNDNAILLSGAIPAAALALIVQFSFDLLDRVVLSPGLRRR